MKTSIWKYQIPGSIHDISMPQGAQIVRFAMQGDTPTLWAHVDPEAPLRQRRFEIFGTGHLVPSGAEYRGTVDDGPYVWHLFEIL